MVKLFDPDTCILVSSKQNMILVTHLVLNICVSESIVSSAEEDASADHDASRQKKKRGRPAKS
jgi:hypothetical protein